MEPLLDCREKHSRGPTSMIAAIKLALELAQLQFAKPGEESSHHSHLPGLLPGCGSGFRWSGWRPADRATLVGSRSFRGLAGLIISGTQLRSGFASPHFLLTSIAAHIFLLRGWFTYTYAQRAPFDFAPPDFRMAPQSYDRFGHFFQGFVPAMITREVFLRLESH